MKKIFLFSLLAAIFTIGFSTDLNAQRYGGKKKKKKTKTSKTDEYFDESGAFHTKLWYGTGANLQFGSFAGGSIFNVGLSPMVGYKITPWLSAGPRISLSYTGYKGRTVEGVRIDGDNYSINPNSFDNNIRRVPTYNFSYGLFSRAKFLETFFVQLEGSNVHLTTPVVISNSGLNYFVHDIETLKPIKDKTSKFNAYVGGGYNSRIGTNFGYDLTIMFILNQEESDTSPPFEIRAGFTYNF